MIFLNDAVVAGMGASWMALVIHEVGHALAAWHAPIISVADGLGNLLGVLLLVTAWDLAGRPGLGTLPGDLLLCSMLANFAGYLNLLPYFRSDGAHWLAHIRAARSRLHPVLSA